MMLKSSNIESFSLTDFDEERIENISRRVKDLWRSHTTIPYFTTHGPDHNEKVISILKMLIDMENIRSEYNENERFFLLAGAWLHDIGMLNLQDFKERFSYKTAREKHHKRSSEWIQINARELNLYIS